MKQIEPLTEAEIDTLRAAWKAGPTARVRQRAQAVYLNHRGYRRLALAELFEVDADTITDWLNSWERQGLRGLYDGTRSGRPLCYTAAEQAQFCRWVEDEPRQRKQAQAQLAEVTGRHASGRTLQRILKKRLPLEAGPAHRE